MPLWTLSSKNQWSYQQQRNGNKHEKQHSHIAKKNEECDKQKDLNES